jgi:hypothetical protein
MGKCIFLVKVGYKICFTTYRLQKFLVKASNRSCVIVGQSHKICFTTYRLQKFLVKACNGSCVIVGQSRLHDLFYYISVTKVFGQSLQWKLCYCWSKSVTRFVLLHIGYKNFWSKLPMKVVLKLKI